MSVSCRLLDLDTEFVLNLPEVVKAKEQIERQTHGSIYFTIQLTPSIRRALTENLNLNCSSIDTVPMRWIKGDTCPHIDKAGHSFDTTYLAYLTDSPGNLVIDGQNYPITKRNAYIFPEGLSHETIETGNVPRLLLGPMSENGISVGAPSTISADGQTETIYFNYTNTYGTRYKINNGSYNGVSLPITIQNTNADFILKVLFETDIIIETDIFYFICGTDNLQFGSKSLNQDGSRPIITIDGVTNYPGLIQNGTSGSDGFNNVYVYNIEVDAVSESTLVTDGGWIGQSYFAKGATSNYIANCSSTGPIIDGGGGIVGGYSASNNSTLYLIGCSSSGDSGTYSGGIVGFEAGNIGGTIICQSCWSTGIIGTNGGGIFGYHAGNGGTVTANKCYSQGTIGTNGGGIFGQETSSVGTSYANDCYSLGLIGTNGGGIYGQYAGMNEGLSYADNCYSCGSIGTDAGGIYGQYAASTSESYTDANHCYSSGSWTGGTRGIYGSNSGSGASSNNCFSSNGTWSNTSANTVLLGTPNPIVGTTWVYTYDDEPYQLVNLGYSPYSITNIINISSLNQTYSVSITAGESTIPAIVPDKSYRILQIFDGQPSTYGTISINSNTGVVSTTSATKEGVYRIIVRNAGSYNITEMILTVNAVPNAPICFPAGTLVLTDQGEVAIDKIDIKKNTIRGNEIIAITETIPLDNYLICIEKSSLAYNVPNRKTIISKDHKIMCDKKLIRAESLIEYIPTISKVKYDKKKLYNVLLKEHSTMSVNNLIVETLNPKSAVAKIYSGNYTVNQRNELIKAFNKFNQDTRKKAVLSRNMLIH